MPKPSVWESPVVYHPAIPGPLLGIPCGRNFTTFGTTPCIVQVLDKQPLSGFFKGTNQPNFPYVIKGDLFLSKTRRNNKNLRIFNGMVLKQTMSIHSSYNHFLFTLNKTRNNTTKTHENSQHGIAKAQAILFWAEYHQMGWYVKGIPQQHTSEVENLEAQSMVYLILFFMFYHHSFSKTTQIHIMWS